jgi:hypothetical protein
MADTQQQQQLTRRSVLLYVLEKVMIPAGVGLFGVWTGVKITRQYEDRHAVSISIIRSDSAAPPEQPAADPFDIFAAPVPTPTPDPNPQYTYTVPVRNNGDFPEENVVIAAAMKGSSPPPQMTSLGFDASSTLLSQTLKVVEPTDPPPSIALNIQRLNPEEWVSIKTSWHQPVEVSVQVRSDHVAESGSS